jgi:hypothetical protein
MGRKGFNTRPTAESQTLAYLSARSKCQVLGRQSLWVVSIASFLSSSVLFGRRFRPRAVLSIQANF